MNSTIVSKVYERLQNALKTGYNSILYYHTIEQYENSRGNVFEVLNSKMECICFIDDSSIKVLIKKNYIEIRESEVGDCFCILTNSKYTKDILKYQTVLIIDGEL